MLARGIHFESLTQNQRIRNLISVVNKLSWEFLLKFFEEIYYATAPTRNLEEAYARVGKDLHNIQSSKWFKFLNTIYYKRPYLIAMYFSSLHETATAMKFALKELEIAEFEYVTCSFDETDRPEARFVKAKLKAKKALTDLMGLVHALSFISANAPNKEPDIEPAKYEVRVLSPAELSMIFNVVEDGDTPIEDYQFKPSLIPLPNTEHSRITVDVINQVVINNELIHFTYLYNDFCEFYDNLYQVTKNIKAQQLERFRTQQQEKEMELAQLRAQVSTQSALLAEKDQEIEFWKRESAKPNRGSSHPGMFKSLETSIRSQTNELDDKFAFGSKH